MKTIQDLINKKEGTQFAKDLSQSMSLNNTMISVGYWNLVVTLRDLKIYSIGLKVHKNWRLSDVKAYFGVKGTTDSLIEQLSEYKKIISSENKANGKNQVEVLTDKISN